MKIEKLRPALKWLIFALLLLVCYILQTTPGLFEVFHTKPVLIVSLAVCVSMYEGVMSSAFFCMTAGLLWDISSDKLFGFNGVILLFYGLIVALLCIYYLHTKVLNALVFCVGLLLIQGVLDYGFYYAIWNLDSSWIIWVQHILPTAAYTVLVTPLLFYLVRFVERKLNENARM